MKYKKLIAKMITNNDNDNLCFVLLYLCVVPEQATCTHTYLKKNLHYRRASFVNRHYRKIGRTKTINTHRIRTLFFMNKELPQLRLYIQK